MPVILNLLYASLIGTTHEAIGAALCEIWLETAA